MACPAREGSTAFYSTFAAKHFAAKCLFVSCYLLMQINGFQVCNKPLTYVLDTPGIMMPAVPSDDVGLKLALAGDFALTLHSW